MFGFISLQTGTELISLALVFNKVTGFYGLLAILTGFELSLLQLTTYIYSIAVLAAIIYLFPHIRKQNAFECIALGWLYVIDVFLHSACTLLFALEWYSTTQLTSTTTPTEGQTGNVVMDSMEGVGATTRVTGKAPPQETAGSMVMIVALIVIRVYFSLVIMAYARDALQKQMQLMILEGPGVDDRDGPFAKDLPEGEGKRGQLGRLMVGWGRGYWMDGVNAQGWAPTAAPRWKSNAPAPTTGEV